MKIVVLAGGLSTERDVSITSGSLVADALRKNGHNVVLLDVFLGYEQQPFDVQSLFDNQYSFVNESGVKETIADIEVVKRARLDQSDCFIGAHVIDICREADIVFLALHGGEGENGQLQAAFDLLGIRYTGSGYLGSALAMNKGLTKSVLIQNGVVTPAGALYKSAHDAASWQHFPCVVKPCTGGSSVGIAKACNREEFDVAIADAFRYENEVVVEQFVQGREFSVGVLGDKALPPIEIIPVSGFYDYSSKYQAGKAVEICPADIDAETDRCLRAAAVAAFHALHLDAYARIDFIVDENGQPYCLEANTLPGMTPTSLLPQEAAVEGMDYTALCETIMALSLAKTER